MDEVSTSSTALIAVLPADHQHASCPLHRSCLWSSKVILAAVGALVFLVFLVSDIPSSLASLYSNHQLTSRPRSYLLRPIQASLGSHLVVLARTESSASMSTVSGMAQTANVLPMQAKPIFGLCLSGAIAFAVLFVTFGPSILSCSTTGQSGTALAATELSKVKSSTGQFSLQSAAACQCQRGKICEAGPQSWRGPLYDRLDCGEDSFFLTDRSIGVADGVSGSRTKDHDPSVLANKLMQYAQESALAHKQEPELSPLMIMQEAYARVQSDSADGAATVLIASISHQGELMTANLGDGALLVIRQGQAVFQTVETLWGFNFPYMLSVSSAEFIAMTSDRKNVPEDSVLATYQLEEGDLIVAGSDGLWDNLFPDELLSLIGNSPDQSVEGLAQLLLREAVAASENRYKKTPFQIHADEAGLDHQGGKPDDCTIVISRVTLQ